MVNITYVEGDAVKALKNGNVDFLMHCCNTKGLMGAGIAKQVKHEFPEAYEKYYKFCKLWNFNASSLGNVIEHDGVLNIIGQSSIGGANRNVHYGAIAKAFMQIALMKSVVNSGRMRPTKIAVPEFMCCGLAGGDWNVMLELFEMLPPTISLYVYKLRLNYER